MQSIKDDELQKLERFIGYGRKDAKVIFIGIEEKGGDYSNLAKRIKAENYEYVDCKRFHLDILNYTHLHNERKDFPVEFTSVWKYMSYFMLRLEGMTVEKIKANKSQLIREYQNNYLGTKDEKGKTLLTELYPIPCQDFNTWGTKGKTYHKIIPQYKSKKEYLKTVLPRRKKIFDELIKSEEFSATIIICYGKTNWNHFKEFFKHFEVNFQDMNVSKECKIGLLNKATKVLLTPFFGRGYISYQVLDEIINEIKEEH